MSNLRPRFCALEKGPSGYGFHLHGEKGKPGQFIRLVEPDSPAADCGLLAGDRLTFVNGESVEGESHQQVVARIRATVGALELIVVDDETAQLLEKLNLKCRKEFVTEGIPLSNDSDHGESQSNGTSRENTPIPSESGEVSAQRLSVSSKDDRAELRPRLCCMDKGTGGYGFNLHSEKTKPGQFIRAVDGDSPAEHAGLLPGDKLVQVNGISVASMSHSEVVGAIKAGGGKVSLLVVSPEAEVFFRSCNVLPTEEHLTGPLPVPGSRKSSSEEEVNGKPADEMRAEVSESTRRASASSNTSLPRAASNTPPPEEEKVPAAAPAPDPGLSMGLSLAEAKERARQKRSAKKAPPMDWSKRNELFSNL